MIPEDMKYPRHRVMTETNLNRLVLTAEAGYVARNVNTWTRGTCLVGCMYLIFK